MKGSILSLHERGKLGTVLLHHFKRRFRLALAALLAAFNLLTDFLKELRILNHERGHLLALRLGNILQLPLRVLIEEKTLDRHRESVARRRFSPLSKGIAQMESPNGAGREVERDESDERKRLNIEERRVKDAYTRTVVADGSCAEEEHSVDGDECVQPMNPPLCGISNPRGDNKEYRRHHSGG